MVTAGTAPGFSATILPASVSATEIFGSADVIIAGVSNAEDLGIARLDRVAFFFHGGRVVLHGLDLLEWLATRLLLGLRMRRAQATDIDNELLGVAAEAERLKQPRRVRIGRRLEHPVGTDDERRSLAGIDRFDGASGFLHL